SDHRTLHSFPTRRSSDLAGGVFVRANRRQLPENGVREQQKKRGEGQHELPFPERWEAPDRSGPIAHGAPPPGFFPAGLKFCKWRSEEHTSELQSRENIVC